MLDLGRVWKWSVGVSARLGSGVGPAGSFAFRPPVLPGPPFPRHPRPSTTYVIRNQVPAQSGHQPTAYFPGFLRVVMGLAAVFLIVLALGTRVDGLSLAILVMSASAAHVCWLTGELVTASDAGLTRSSWGRRRSQVSWSDIVEVRRSSAWGRVDLFAESGGVSLWDLMVGVGSVGYVCLARLPPHLRPAFQAFVDTLVERP